MAEAGMEQGKKNGEGPPEGHTFHIQIDRVHFEVTEANLSGAQLRQLPSPPIGEDRDLYEIRPGEPDHLVEDGESINMHDGLRFFTAPKQINPGV
ncbi:MAG: multiubiquitin domain-containing protein [Actinomycetota bacterium]